jgi:hypothetical protein
MIHRVPVVVALVVLSGCGSNLCERSTKANAQIKGDCPAETVSPLLGAMCTANLNSCSAADQKLLESTLGCIEKLPVCLSITKDAWKLQSETCTAELAMLSRPCLDAFFQGEPPGFDAGVPDAGPRPILDGGNGVSLIGTANENTIALAWELRRTAAIEKWILIQTDAVGENKFETELTPGGSINLLIPDSGMSGRRFYLAGTNANGDVLTGTATYTRVINTSPTNQFNTAGTLSTATLDELETLVPLNIIWDAGYGDSNVQPLTLRGAVSGTQHHMAMVYNVSGAAGLLDTWIEFTKE